MHWMIELSAYITAGGIIIGVLISLRNKIKDFFIRDIMEEERITHMEVKANELIIMINHYPHNKRAIIKAFEEYKELGGNSYVQEIYEIWLKSWKEN